MEPNHPSEIARQSMSGTLWEEASPWLSALHSRLHLRENVIEETSLRNKSNSNFFSNFPQTRHTYGRDIVSLSLFIYTMIESKLFWVQHSLVYQIKLVTSTFCIPTVFSNFSSVCKSLNHVRSVGWETSSRILELLCKPSWSMAYSYMIYFQHHKISLKHLSNW